MFFLGTPSPNPPMVVKTNGRPTDPPPYQTTKQQTTNKQTNQSTNQTNRQDYSRPGISLDTNLNVA
jgi:hypothetical protein